MDSPQGKGSFKGRLVVASGNKVRIEMSGEGGGKTTDLLVVSDGTKAVTVQDKKVQPARDTPENMGKHVLTGLARGGIFVPMYLAVETSVDGEKPRKVDLAESLKVSGLKLGKKDKVDGKEAQALEYLLTVASAGELKLNTTVWVDAKTRVPLKRLLTAKIGDQALSVTETYSKVEMDEKIDPRTFELPK